MVNNVILSGFSTINWKQKLSSRKLWVGVILVAIGVVMCVTGDVENGMRLISIGGGVYLGVETLVDVMRIVFVQSKEIETTAGADTAISTEATTEGETATQLEAKAEQ